MIALIIDVCDCLKKRIQYLLNVFYISNLNEILIADDVYD